MLPEKHYNEMLPCEKEQYDIHYLSEFMQGRESKLHRNKTEFLEQLENFFQRFANPESSEVVEIKDEESDRIEIDKLKFRLMILRLSENLYEVSFYIVSSILNGSDYRYHCSRTVAYSEKVGIIFKERMAHFESMYDELVDNEINYPELERRCIGGGWFDNGNNEMPDEDDDDE